MRRNFLIAFFVFIAVLFSNCLSIFATERIEELFLRSDYPAVIEEGSQVLSRGTNQANLDKIYFYLGLSNIKMGNFSEARNDFSILLRDFANSSFRERAELAIADSYFSEENYSEANKFYEKLVSNPSSDILSLVYYKLAQANIKLGNWKQAKNYLEKLKNDFPMSFEASLAKDANVSEEFFTVQVGSFIDSEKAKKLCSDLKVSGFEAYIVETLAQGKTFYRVRVGKLASLKDAKELQQRLSDKNYPTKIFP